MRYVASALLIALAVVINTVAATTTPTVVPVTVTNDQTYNATWGDLLNITFNDGHHGKLYQFYTLKAFNKCDTKKALAIASTSTYEYQTNTNSSNWYVVELYDIARGALEEAGQGQQPPPIFPPKPLPDGTTPPTLGESFPLYFGVKSSMKNRCKTNKDKAIVHIAVGMNTPPPVDPTTPPTQEGTVTTPPSGNEPDGTDPPTDEDGKTGAEPQGSTVSDLVIGAGVLGGVSALSVAAAIAVIRRNKSAKLQRRPPPSTDMLAGFVKGSDDRKTGATIMTGYTENVLGGKRDTASDDGYALSNPDPVVSITPSLARAISLDSGDVHYATTIDTPPGSSRFSVMSSRIGSTISAFIFYGFNRASRSSGDSEAANSGPRSGKNTYSQQLRAQALSRRERHKTEMSKTSSKSRHPRRSRKPRGAATSADAYALVRHDRKHKTPSPKSTTSSSTAQSSSTSGKKRNPGYSGTTSRRLTQSRRVTRVPRRAKKHGRVSETPSQASDTSRITWAV